MIIDNTIFIQNIKVFTLLYNINNIQILISFKIKKIFLIFKNYMFMQLKIHSFCYYYCKLIIIGIEDFSWHKKKFYF